MELHEYRSIVNEVRENRKIVMKGAEQGKSYFDSVLLGDCQAIQKIIDLTTNILVASKALTALRKKAAGFKIVYPITVKELIEGDVIEFKETIKMVENDVKHIFEPGKYMVVIIMEEGERLIISKVSMLPDNTGEDIEYIYNPKNKERSFFTSFFRRADKDFTVVGRINNVFPIQNHVSVGGTKNE